MYIENGVRENTTSCNVRDVGIQRFENLILENGYLLPRTALEEVPGCHVAVQTHQFSAVP